MRKRALFWHLYPSYLAIACLSLLAVAAYTAEVLHRVYLDTLKAVRRDFVANVSHELKTPITSIKGFVETLRDGAMHDPEDASRFLEIIARQADRLHAIIEDMLSLSRIEQEKEDIVVSHVSLADIIKLAIECCRMKCEEKNITCEWHCGGDLEARVNPPLLEQALVNLIDNAIKYSDDGGRIEITALRDSGHIRIDVKDWGCGVGREHLTRVFERFYRVDKARSRKLGGTGLGLAIVKHISQAHGGHVAVESTLGVGSTFTIFLP